DLLGALQVELFLTLAGSVQHFKLRLVDLQAAALPALFHLAVERYELAGLEAIAQVFAVKPDALERGASLAGHQLKDRHALARAENSGVAHLGDHGSHLARAQLADAARIQPVFIAERQVVEQVFDGGDALLLQPFGDAWADSFHEFDWRRKV